MPSKVADGSVESCPRQPALVIEYIEEGVKVHLQVACVYYGGTLIHGPGGPGSRGSRVQGPGHTYLRVRHASDLEARNGLHWHQSVELGHRHVQRR